MKTCRLRISKWYIIIPSMRSFLDYLVVDYTPEEYEAEVKRLEEYKSTDGEGRIIYAEQIFCNYFMDLDYKEYIPEEYLLDGFDATTETAYYQKMTGK